MSRAPLLASLVLAASLVLTGCAGSAPGVEDGRLRVVATTGLLADLVREVGGDDAHVTALIPDGQDPHSFEPSLRTTREVAHAKVQFANGLLLEPHNLVSTMREVGTGKVVDVADQASTRGATLVPLVENVGLDAVWLGLRIYGAEKGSGPVTMRMTRSEGPGTVTAYVLSTFGTPTPLFRSESGGDNSTALPANAHTHVSWGFSEPGIYRVHFAADSTREAPITIAVGVQPPAGMKVIDAGHIDIAANLERGDIELRDQDQIFDPVTTVIAVKSSTLQPIPADPSFRFLGVPGSETYLLPQAVLGQHIHGEVDPHLWHNVRNVMAYVDVIADELANADPSRGYRYRERAEAYRKRLKALDSSIKEEVSHIPPQYRHLVTTHHGYAYLEQGYGIEAAGFVTPNPSVEPSPRDVIALRRTLENLRVPAVFVEPQAVPSASTLTESAAEQGIEVCTIYGDSLDDRVRSYEELMKFNAAELRRCLGKETQ